MNFPCTLAPHYQRILKAPSQGTRTSSLENHLWMGRKYFFFAPGLSSYVGSILLLDSQFLSSSHSFSHTFSRWEQLL